MTLRPPRSRAYVDLASGYQPSAQAQASNVPDSTVTLQQPPQDDETIQAIAAILLSGLAASALVNALMELGIPRLSSTSVQAAVNLTAGGTSTMPRLQLNGEAASDLMRRTRAQEAFFRAGYILHAARRIEDDLREGDTVRTAIAHESPYYRQHEQARVNRADSSRQVSRMATIFGDTLGWYVNPLLNNEIECLRADGHNFRASVGTIIGYPGAVHPNCGCTAGPPIEGAGWVDDAVTPILRHKDGTKVRLRVA